jgi:hypothetical protein
MRPRAYLPILLLGAMACSSALKKDAGSDAGGSDAGNAGAPDGGGGDAGDGSARDVLSVDGIREMCDVRDFGAVGDGVALDTAAVQTALDHCTTATVSPGTYLVGPLFLRSNLTVDVQAGATLVASTNMADFTAGAARNGGVQPSIINGNNITMVTMKGSGTIDGSGAPWWAAADNAAAMNLDDPWRPYLIYVKHVTGFTLQDLHLQNSPKFHVLIESSSNVTVDGLTISAPADSPNTDGVDPKSSKHVTITNCNISVGDDNVAVTSSGSPSPTAADIIVENNTFGRGHGVSIGSPTSGGVGGMTVRHCTFTNTQNGIRIKTARDRGGEITGLVYDDLQMTGVTNAIYFTDYYPDIPKPGTDTAMPITGTTPNIHDLTISNVTATGGKRAGYMLGLPEQMIANIQLTNVNISAMNGLELRNTQGIHFSGSSITASTTPPLILDENAGFDGLDLGDGGVGEGGADDGGADDGGGTNADGGVTDAADEAGADAAVDAGAPPADGPDPDAAADVASD